jgi:rubrerythrin
MTGTGVSDPLYNLILLTQQALEDCLRYEEFSRDAREGGDDELADYFEELHENDREVAARSKEMLRVRLQATVNE